MECGRQYPASLTLDIGRLDDRAPQFHVGLQERGQLSCRGGRGHRGDFRKSLKNLWMRKRRNRVAMKLSYDVTRCLGGYVETVPSRIVIPWHSGFCDRWKLGGKL